MTRKIGFFVSPKKGESMPESIAERRTLLPETMGDETGEAL